MSFYISFSTMLFLARFFDTCSFWLCALLCDRFVFLTILIAPHQWINNEKYRFFLQFSTPNYSWTKGILARTYAHAHTHIMHPFHILFVRRSLSLFEREKKKKKKLNRIAWERGTSKDNINLIYSLVHCTLHARSTYIVGVCLFSFIFLRKRSYVYTLDSEMQVDPISEVERERERNAFTHHIVYILLACDMTNKCIKKMNNMTHTLSMCPLKSELNIYVICPVLCPMMRDRRPNIFQLYKYLARYILLYYGSHSMVGCLLRKKNNNSDDGWKKDRILSYCMIIVFIIKCEKSLLRSWETDKNGHKKSDIIFFDDIMLSRPRPNDYYEQHQRRIKHFQIFLSFLLLSTQRFFSSSKK